MEYRFDDRALHAEEFLRFVNRVWPGDYDPARTEEALGRTICLTARDNGTIRQQLPVPGNGCGTAF